MNKRSLYDPRTREIKMSPGASLYSRFHELAHKEQHDTMAPVYLAWAIFRQIRFVDWFVTLCIEYDAHRRARRVMQRLEVWSDEACQEGRNNLISYAMRKESC
jgi:hypothetical protein